MKSRAALPILLFFISFLPFHGLAQQCTPVSKANDINPDQLCSPVEVVTWEVSYSGVDASVTTVEIYIDWDDGNTQTYPTTQSPGRVFTAIANHTYASTDDKCNFKPTATMEVDGTRCTSQWQEQIVTIWDVDNKNGAYVRASPSVYPVCIGDGASMRFYDDTRYNCVPPQEEDNRNESTRWIQWVYGTNHGDANDMTSSGSDVLVNNSTRAWPYSTPVKTLPGPSWGSSERSLTIAVDDDKLIGQEFEVELRYWNYCNKWTDGAAPVIDRSVIRIVGLPDATIDPAGPVCEFGTDLHLTAADGGGAWSGAGITDTAAGTFSPFIAGPGFQSVHYAITDGSGCFDEDDALIEVFDAPDATITPVDPVCFGDAPFNMIAATSPGIWAGTGITSGTDGTFSPAVAGFGSYEITYKTATDTSGCFGVDTTIMHVVPPPFAVILTPDSAWCQQETNGSIGTILFTGLDTSLFDLIYEARGILDTLFSMSSDTFDLFLNNMPGENLYVLKKVIEHHGTNSCETIVDDTLRMTVYTSPPAIFTIGDVDYCSPVEVRFDAVEGYNSYSWNFGDGDSDESSSNQISHIFRYDYTDNFFIEEGDTVYDLSRHDTLFHITMHAETIHGCTGEFEDSIRIYPNPRADFFVSPLLQNHPDSLVYLINLSSVGPWDYYWDFGDSINSDLKDPNEHIFENWGIFDISLATYSPFCADTVVKRVQIMPPPPVSGFEPDTFGCPPLSITFSNYSLYADTYIWDFGDGKFSSDREPTHTFYDSREHIVRLRALGLSGTDTTQRKVLVYEPPLAIFDIYPRSSRNLKQTFKFTNNSVGASYYLWDFGDGTTSSDAEPAHIYEDSGSYTISLYVWSDQDCVDTLIMDNVITVRAGEGFIDFPNAFAWNGSGPTGGGWSEGTIDNTVFHPKVVNAKTFRMVIYTRWGEQIFESNDLYIGWDGYMKGGILATEGVYVWKAWIKYVDGVEEITMGDITFLH
ncbi:MAG: PKD domain-containing protein [Bacteroidetes bacterium]|nr:PKD domain-containing protein [Bacteroidota bacterium]